MFHKVTGAEHEVRLECSEVVEEVELVEKDRQ